MKKKLSILGSTGSIGTQTLELVDLYPELFEICALTAYENTDLLLEQIHKYKPKYVGIVHREKGIEIVHEIPDGVEVFLGEESIRMCTSISEVDTVLIAIVGIAGLPAVIECIKHNKKIALANKESLVTGGKIINEMLEETGQFIIPVDSEHSAIFQCLQGIHSSNEVSKLILTASGGPFLKWDYKDLSNIGIQDALNHPNWSMGKKISVDSSTLMNKGLEVIEAHWLFRMPQDRIEVVIHPQSIIHSMIECIDHSVLAQMGTPDMKIPILYALTFPERWKTEVKALDLIRESSLTFEKPDLHKFPCLGLAYDALRQGGTMTTTLNAANEVCASLFLQGKIGFIDIPKFIENAMSRVENIKNPRIEDIYYIDSISRDYILTQIKGF